MSEQSSDSKILVFLAGLSPNNNIENFTFKNYQKNVHLLESMFFLEKAKNPDISTEAKNDFLTQSKEKFSLTYLEDNLLFE